MREAFGGIFMIRLFLVFMFIYVAFTAVSLNYAKAYRVKNRVIDFVEQNEVISLDEYFGNSLILKDKTKLDEALDELGYNRTCTTSEEITTSEGVGYCYRGVIFLKEREEEIKGTEKTDENTSKITTSKIVYYKIKTYADWNMGALNKLLILAGSREDADKAANGTWVVNGEAKVVVKN